MAKVKKVKSVLDKVKDVSKKLKKVVKAKAVKVAKAKTVKAAKAGKVSKNIAKVKKPKTKTYKVSGKFSVDSEGNIVKPSKSIETVKKIDDFLNKNGNVVVAYLATFVIEAK